MALLCIVLYKLDNTTFRGDIPELPKWTGPPRTVVMALVLLYLGLAATMVSVLFSIFDKQLFGPHTLANTSGSDAENAKNRQPTPEQTVKSHNDLFVRLFLLLQFALFLISCALTVYTWHINRTIAIFTLIFSIYVLGGYLQFQFFPGECL